MKKKNILVDMSCSILHHGHVRLLRKASKFGKVIVALTTDKEIKKHKGFNPELKFKFRKEILQSIIYVAQVIPSKWKIKDKFLKKNNIDVLVRGSDYKKEKFSVKTIFFPRTKNISSSKLRKNKNR